ncbi:hypothetical protein M2349_001212 [Caldanaerobacter subterraneus subsp. tengcongensis MB4]|uniref:Uncharacterized protein n=1 Tax=Caldanaerobacter subterraneus subsp. tengcongensis (strain DSM 15242 / JCM 11007 / NBRC 100824 / MB4) TaxID=273068 RepID=Q8RAQ9_CALS4|nr:MULTISPECIES: hypothetical protein [Thermoanaerobacteraceae]AAM24379.1 hypothetical protein TTE1147 [Caldanaerobacter subterraneus subsp. tengcongensis MB4]MCS3916071.1 hypothetical protein [Caldanaerobacter subterraneus subsp. tengcongensis MB4]UZQ83929.1 hypothetical protein OEI98_001081 [Thermoanaerobacter sp. RKWS2]
MSVVIHEGIYQIHWCIHGGVVAMPLSLTNRALEEVASEIVEKGIIGIREEQILKQLFADKLALSESLSWEK